MKLFQLKNCTCPSSRLSIDNDHYSNNLKGNDMFKRRIGINRSLRNSQGCFFNGAYIRRGAIVQKSIELCLKLKCSRFGEVKLAKMNNCQYKSK